MAGWRYIFRCVAVVGALVLIAPAAALSDSAGDQQYVDPLAGTPTSSSAPASTHASAPSPAPAPASASASSLSSSSATTSATSTSTSSAVTSSPSAQATSATLPYTGLDAWLCAGAGVGLLGAGLGMRRLARR